MDNKQEQVTQPDIMTDHILFKDVVADIFKTRYAISKISKLNLGKFIEYLLSVNSHLFFTTENITVLTDFINLDVDARDFLLSFTDAVVLDFIGQHGNLDLIIKHIADTIDINKNKNKLYDSRLADSHRFDRELLVELLEGNSYIFITYYLVVYQEIVLEAIDE